MFFFFILIHSTISSLVTFRCIKSNRVPKRSILRNTFKREFLKVLVGCIGDLPPGPSCIRDMETLQIKFDRTKARKKINFENYDPNNDPFSINYVGPSFKNMIFILENIRNLAQDASDLKTLYTQYYTIYNMYQEDKSITLKNSKQSITSDVQNKQELYNDGRQLNYSLVIPVDGNKVINAQLEIQETSSNLFSYKVSGNGLLCWPTAEFVDMTSQSKINQLFDEFFNPVMITNLQVREGFTISNSDLDYVLQKDQIGKSKRKELFNDHLVIKTEDDLLRMMVKKKDKTIEFFDEGKILDKDSFLSYPMLFEIFNLDWY